MIYSELIFISLRDTTRAKSCIHNPSGYPGIRVFGYPGIRVCSHQNQKGTEIIYILLRINSQFDCLPPSEKKVNVVGCVTKSL